MKALESEHAARGGVSAMAWASAHTHQTLLSRLDGISCTPIASIEELEQCHHAGISCVVLDLEYVGEQVDDMTSLVERMRDVAGTHCILLIALSADSVRHALAFRDVDNVDHFITGGDPSSLSDMIRRSAVLPERDPMLNTLSRLTDPLKQVMLTAAEDPDAWPLKRILTEAGVSRSTLERRLEELALPSPARLLRHFALRATRHRPHSA